MSKAGPWIPTGSPAADAPTAALGEDRERVIECWMRPSLWGIWVPVPRDMNPMVSEGGHATLTTRLELNI